MLLLDLISTICFISMAEDIKARKTRSSFKRCTRISSSLATETAEAVYKSDINEDDFKSCHCFMDMA